MISALSEPNDGILGVYGETTLIDFVVNMVHGFLFFSSYDFFLSVWEELLGASEIVTAIRSFHDKQYIMEQNSNFKQKKLFGEFHDITTFDLDVLEHCLISQGFDA